MDAGRIQAVVLANTKSNVIYERFYAKFSDLERASIREAFLRASEGLRLGAAEEAEQCSRFRGGVIVVRAESDLLLYALGTGEYDELNLAEVLRAVASALRSFLKKPPTESLLLDNYGQLCLAVDEVIQEGILEYVDPEDMRRHRKLQVNVLIGGTFFMERAKSADLRIKFGRFNLQKDTNTIHWKQPHVHGFVLTLETHAF